MSHGEIAHYGFTGSRRPGSERTDVTTQTSSSSSLFLRLSPILTVAVVVG